MRRLVALVACGVLAPQSAAAGDGVNYVTQIKPILAARCYACHSALRQQSGLRLDTASFLVRGGDSGAAVEPGKSSDSLVVQYISGEGGIRMPPEDDGAALSEAQIALIKTWIDEGARAPDETPLPDPRDHWAFQPPVRPPFLEVQNASWATNPVDAFIAAGHESRGLAPVATAEKAVLLRRIYLDLVGLPPKREQLLAFIADESPSAYERVVDELLASPQYGERWARHWMDVWRYSDWSGYKEEIRVSARHIWRWRDWIVESLNADKGYDRMVVEMLAADEAAPDDASVLPATGFLARNWYKFNRNTWLESTVEHTAKAFLGITMNCCRCHDHKYDPISQLEYYELRAIFEPHDVRTDRVTGQPDVLKDGLARACDMKLNAPTYVFERGNEKHPDKTTAVSPAVPEALSGKLTIEPIDLPLTVYYPALQEFALREDLSQAEKRASDSESALRKAQTAGYIGRLAAKQLATARAAHAALSARIEADKAKYGVIVGADAAKLAQAAAKAERELALCQAQEQSLTAQQELERAKLALKEDDEATRAAVATAEKKLVDIEAAIAKAHAALADPGDKYTPLGEELPRTSTGRRLGFAKWVTDRKNPLAARVAVNHIWLRHFGAPLVDNVFDFGLRSPQPRNQALLDWLAVELMDHDWKMKHIHRLLVTSNTYRMRSSSAGATAANVELDPDNHYLWRMNTRRLEAEVVRDALFQTAGKLDLTRGGPDIDRKLALTTPRRSLYFRHAYEKEVKFLQLFDGASVNECYRRSESVVPQQALALANSEVSIDQSRRLAARLSKLAAKQLNADEAFVTFAFEQVLNRKPSSTELAECRSFLESQATMLKDPKKLTQLAGGPKTTVAPSADPGQRARENLTLVLYNHNDFVTIR